MDRNNSQREYFGRNCIPPGLKGREIGMFYKARQKAQRAAKDQNVKKFVLGSDISVPNDVLENVREYINKFTSAPEQVNKSHEFEHQFRHLLNVDFKKFIEECKVGYEGVIYNNKSLDEKLKRQYEDQHNNVEFLNRYKKRLKLPAMEQSESVIRTVYKNQVVLVVGSTGCGKTTQVPQILLDEYIKDGRGSECRIVCTQPRRIAAITVAERVAYERCEHVGISVGYQIRLENKLPREHGSILFCTTGILLQKIQTDPLLHEINVLIIDEVHERSHNVDLLMGLLKLILPHRTDLKLILMSATVREEDFCNYFNNCPMLRIDGTLYPVQVLYLEDIIQETGYTNFGKEKTTRPRREQNAINDMHKNMIEPYIRQIRHQYNKAVLDALRFPDSEGCANLEFIEHLIYYISAHKPDGAILVFLPSYEKITKLCSMLQNPASGYGRIWSQKLVVYPLHSILPTVEQQAIFERPSVGKRKVVISTILAETSITIDDVVYVINTGRTKLSNYDIGTNTETLDEVWVSKANSQQRKGRAGRVQPGICYNLFTRAREAIMEEVPLPEILRCRLEQIILNLTLLHISNLFEFLDSLLSPPNPNAIRSSIQILKRIEALDANGNLTPLGVHLARLPVEPQMGKMMLMAALLRCMDPITSAAAALSYKTPFYQPLGKQKEVDSIKRKFDSGMRSDLLMIHHTICKYRDAGSNHNQINFCYNNFLKNTTMQQLERMKQQFADLLYNAKFIEMNNTRFESSNVNSNNLPLLRAVIAAGLYPNMAFLRKVRMVKNTVRHIHSMDLDDGRRVNFHPSSVNSGESSFKSRYFVYFQKQKSTSLYLLDATMVYPMALVIFGDCVQIGETEDNVTYLSVGQIYHFKCNYETAVVIIELRDHLAKLLLKKALHPEPISRDEEQLIKAIEILLTIDEYKDEYDSANEM